MILYYHRIQSNFWSKSVNRRFMYTLVFFYNCDIKKYSLKRTTVFTNLKRKYGILCSQAKSPGVKNNDLVNSKMLISGKLHPKPPFRHTYITSESKSCFESYEAVYTINKFKKHYDKDTFSTKSNLKIKHHDVTVPFFLKYYVLFLWHVGSKTWIDIFTRIKTKFEPRLTCVIRQQRYHPDWSTFQNTR